MPHTRKRHIAPLLQSTLRFSPIVGVFGHRQVGKTTLVTGIASEYETLDKRDQFLLSNETPETYITKRKRPFAIDEAQLSPPLFPALKEHVRMNKAPGQFILTGSVRFSSRREIRESLTGRIVAWELLPMDLTEIHEKPLRHALTDLLLSKDLQLDLSPSTYWKPNTIDQYLEYGGLPGLFSIRNARIRQQKMELQIETLLERDLRLVVDTTLSFSSIRNLLVELASIQGEPFDLTSISRRAQISAPTLMRLVGALESIFLIRFLPVEGTSRKKVLFFEDQGEATYLSLKPPGHFLDRIRFLFSQVRPQLLYREGPPIRLYQFRNRGGAYVPIVLDSKNTSPLGLIPLLEEIPSRQALGSARSFVQKTGGRVLMVHEGKRDELIHPQIRVLPYSKLF